MGTRRWLVYTVITTLFWGVWGAFIELPEKAGFPATLGYVAWALTMIPCSVVALRIAGWKLNADARSVFLGSAVGVLGAGGQLILFQALRLGPAYLVFPIVSLYPVVTIVLSVGLLRERASRRAWIGILLALPAILLLSYSPPTSDGVSAWTWIVLAFVVFLFWGVQAYVIKFANVSMMAESIFFYMMATGLVLVPLAVWMTEFSASVNWGWTGLGRALLIQVLNAIGALTLVYAVRYGTAIIVVPMTALAPVITVILSLILYGVVPGPVLIAGIVLATIAIFLMAE
jgi:drug/metabolite transporter (DMT)-like permease